MLCGTNQQQLYFHGRSQWQFREEKRASLYRGHKGRYRDQDSVQTCHSQLPEYLLQCKRTLRLLNGVDRVFEFWYNGRVEWEAVEAAKPRCW
jgi:hypothetical protein